MVLNTLAYIVVLIVVVILIVVLLKFLFGVLAIAPIVAYGDEDAKQQEKDVVNQDEQKTVDKATIKTNDTDIHIICTSNIPDLVSCD